MRAVRLLGPAVRLGSEAGPCGLGRYECAGADHRKPMEVCTADERRTDNPYPGAPDDSRHHVDLLYRLWLLCLPLFPGYLPFPSSLAFTIPMPVSPVKIGSPAGLPADYQRPGQGHPCASSAFNMSRAALGRAPFASDDDPRWQRIWC